MSEANPVLRMDNLSRLLVIMAQLRDPQYGCPWDLKQTFATIAPHTIEEAYEVADAIEREDFADLKDELGDLLLQVVYHAQMAHERDLFTLDDIAKAIADKLVRRHPHVFGDAEFEDDAQLRVQWEARKSQERQARHGRLGRASRMDGIAKALPELSRAAKLQRRAAQAGFDWPETFEVFFKIDEELGEIKRVLEQNGAHERLEDELGDLLFAVVNLARHLYVDPERALRGGNRKFERRFRAIEQRLAEQGREPQQCSLEELDALWEDVKRQD